MLKKQAELKDPCGLKAEREVSGLFVTAYQPASKVSHFFCKNHF